MTHVYEVVKRKIQNLKIINLFMHAEVEVDLFTACALYEYTRHGDFSSSASFNYRYCLK
jgi:hypothetical protein